MELIQYSKNGIGYVESKGDEALKALSTISWDQNFFFPDNWNKYYPYKMAILSPIDGTSKYLSHWEFVLPIPPQELTITGAIATNVQATLNGIVEYHNGSPFRDITLQGTTGFTPIKNSVVAQLPPVLGYILGGSLNDLSSANPLNIFKSNINKGLSYTDLDPDRIPTESTGYYQFRLFQQFLEQYLELKKSKIQVNTPKSVVNSTDLRLALIINKDEAAYICSGVSFDMKRAVNSPMEYLYTLKLKAWKRVNPAMIDGGSFDSPIAIPSAKLPNIATGILNLIKNASTAFQSINDLLNSVGNGLGFALSETIRNLSGGVKSILNIPLSVLDLPHNLFQNVVASMQAEIADYNNLDVGNQLQTKWNQLTQDLYGINVTTDTVNYPGLDGRRIPSHILPKPGDEPMGGKLHDFFDGLNPRDIKLSSTMKNAIFQYQNKVANQTRTDYENMANQLDAISIQITTLKPNLTDDELNTLFYLDNLIQSLDYLAMSRDVNPPKFTSLEYIAGLAQRSGIAFTTPVSKFAIPFPYNHTLEQVSQMYLGNTDRWHEIAALNGLRAPYVDETGFQLPFLVNGDGRKCYVSDKTNLYIGQYVWISSLNKPNNKRTINNIREIYTGFVEVELSGNADLDSYVIAASATLQAFLPGTVNSQQVIYIPSANTPREDPKLSKVPDVDEMDTLLDVGGVDLLLTPDGDLAITPDGDCKLAYGMQNIIQRIKLALSTKQGTLPLHPEYGINFDVGDSIADVNIKELTSAILTMFKGDSTFRNVASLDIQQNGPVLMINIVLEINGTSQILPISFGLNL
jgi:hypothetical protein